MRHCLFSFWLIAHTNLLSTLTSTKESTNKLIDGQIIIIEYFLRKSRQVTYFDRAMKLVNYLVQFINTDEIPNPRESVQAISPVQIKQCYFFEQKMKPFNAGR